MKSCPPSGTSPISFVDIRDIAAVVCHCLVNAMPHGAIYDLTGPETLTYDEIAARLSGRLGKPVSVRSASDAELWHHFIGSGMSGQDAHSLLTHYQTYRARPCSAVTGWIEILTGRTPIGLDRFTDEILGGGMSRLS